MEASAETVRVLRDRLLDPWLPIARRFRALFSLRNLRGDGAREALSAALHDPSCLLAHEAAFALGQIQDSAALPDLVRVLQDEKSHPMVRHEAAEALGAIGSAESRGHLEAGLEDSAPEVRETCELALRRLGQQQGAEHSFLSVDPACPAPDTTTSADLREYLLRESEPMYERYSALFALRNRRTPQAVEAIIAALGCSSALLRHEVAYVLGQLQDKAATAALVRVLGASEEHPMVRHEAAEALGAIADTNSIALLKEFACDREPIVAESCQVALDMIEFELLDNSFEYADVPRPHSLPMAVSEAFHAQETFRV